MGDPWVIRGSHKLLRWFASSCIFALGLVFLFVRVLLSIYVPTYRFRLPISMDVCDGYVIRPEDGGGVRESGSLCENGQEREQERRGQ